MNFISIAQVHKVNSPQRASYSVRMRHPLPLNHEADVEKLKDPQQGKTLREGKEKERSFMPRRQKYNICHKYISQKEHVPTDWVTTWSLQDILQTGALANGTGSTHLN